MARSEENVNSAADVPPVPASSANVINEAAGPSKKKPLLSKRVTDHLANERTFLAWVRTGLAVIAFGFVVERFGLLLRELGLKSSNVSLIPGHFSAAIGITLTILGTILLVVALANFLRVRRSIDEEHFHPSAGFAIFLTVIMCLIGLLLAIYLFFTA